MQSTYMFGGFGVNNPKKNIAYTYRYPNEENGKRFKENRNSPNVNASKWPDHEPTDFKSDKNDVGSTDDGLHVYSSSKKEKIISPKGINNVEFDTLDSISDLGSVGWRTLALRLNHNFVHEPDTNQEYVKWEQNNTLTKYFTHLKYVAVAVIITAIFVAIPLSIVLHFKGTNEKQTNQVDDKFIWSLETEIKMKLNGNYTAEFPNDSLMEKRNFTKQFELSVLDILKDNKYTSNLTYDINVTSLSPGSIIVKFVITAKSTFILDGLLISLKIQQAIKQKNTVLCFGIQSFVTLSMKENGLILSRQISQIPTTTLNHILSIETNAFLSTKEITTSKQKGKTMITSKSSEMITEYKAISETPMTEKSTVAKTIGNATFFEMPTTIYNHKTDHSATNFLSETPLTIEPNSIAITESIKSTFSDLIIHKTTNNFISNAHSSSIITSPTNVNATLVQMKVAHTIQQETTPLETTTFKSSVIKKTNSNNDLTPSDLISEAVESTNNLRTSNIPSLSMINSQPIINASMFSTAASSTIEQETTLLESTTNQSSAMKKTVSNNDITPSFLISEAVKTTDYLFISMTPSLSMTTPSPIVNASMLQITPPSAIEQETTLLETTTYQSSVMKKTDSNNGLSPFDLISEAVESINNIRTSNIPFLSMINSQPIINASMFSTAAYSTIEQESTLLESTTNQSSAMKNTDSNNDITSSFLISGAVNTTD